MTQSVPFLDLVTLHGEIHRTGDFPVAERISKEVFSLPMFPDITEEQQRRVVDSIAGFEWEPVAAAS